MIFVVFLQKLFSALEILVKCRDNPFLDGFSLEGGNCHKYLSISFRVNFDNL